jgi:hypothetical protein
VDLTDDEIENTIATDPRVIAAKAAMDAFRASPAGISVQSGRQSIEAFRAIDPDDRARWTAHYDNYWTTRGIVAREMGLFLSARISTGEEA